MRLRNMLTRWTRKLRRRWLVLRLSRIDAQRRRIEALPVAADRSAALSRARTLEALCVERARVRYFISGGDEDLGVPSASSTVAWIVKTASRPVMRKSFKMRSWEQTKVSVPPSWTARLRPATSVPMP